MKYLLILFIILIIAGCKKQAEDFNESFNVIDQNLKLINRYQEAKSDIQTIQEAEEERNREILNELEDDDAAPSVQAIKIPESFDLPIKFVSQAPNANWDELHKEACEEAAMITVAKYMKGENLDELIMEDEIQAMVRWETEQGYKIDLTAEEAVQILKDYFSLKAEVVDEVTVERIKRELSLGNLVITPHAGQELGNPYYRQPGPIYHFLVIRGWTKSEFITNDVGTKRGDSYKYKFEKIITTVHDWNGGEVANGQKVMIVVGGVD